MNDKQIQSLKIFFKTSISAFEIAEMVSELGGKEIDTKFKALADIHNQCLDILQTEPIDLPKLYLLLGQCEMIASQPEKPIVREEFKTGYYDGSK